MTDLDSPAQLLIPLVAFFGGVLSKTLSDWLSAHFTTKREREARNEIRRDILRQRRADFQRETLIALQDACMRFIRATTQTHLHDVTTFRNTGQWQIVGIPGDVDEAVRLGHSALSALAVRVRDEEVRQLVQAIQSRCMDATRCLDEAASNRHMDDVNPLYQRFNDRVGQILRDLDAEEEQEN